MKNKLKHLVPVLLAIATITGSLSACELKPKAQQKVSKQGFYFDTIIQITLYGTTDEKYIDDCFDMAKKYEDMLSNTVSYSEVSKINDAAGKEYVTVSDDTLELIKKGIEYGDTSDGRFDITIGKLSDLWNFSEIAENTDSKDNEVDASVVPSDAQIQSELSHVNYRNIQINGNDVMLTDSKAKLDLGGIAKGFIADKMKAYLQSKKITSGIINLGGNVLTVGKKSDGSDYTVGIQKPFDESGEPICTGYPVKNNLYSVTIISDSSCDGDALSTTCFALGIDKAKELINSLSGVEAIFVTDDYSIITTSDEYNVSTE